MFFVSGLVIGYGTVTTGHLTTFHSGQFIGARSAPLPWNANPIRHIQSASNPPSNGAQGNDRKLDPCYPWIYGHSYNQTVLYRSVKKEPWLDLHRHSFESFPAAIVQSTDITIWSEVSETCPSSAIFLRDEQQHADF
jgi:hypothetical protein